MSTGTGIEWTNVTWNPVVGCTRASAGCDNCYAVTMTHRLEAMGQVKYAGLTVLNPAGERHFNGVVRTVPEALAMPRRWRLPRRVFVNSMSDLFHKDVPESFICKVWDAMAETPRHTFQILTKRPERAAKIIPMFADRHTARNGTGWPLPNVWMGTSVENQKAADERIPHLLNTPAAVRFLSCEPLLGPLDIKRFFFACTGCGTSPCECTGVALRWIIVGGESGPGARTIDADWARTIRDQCANAGVAFFMKQMDKREPIPEDLFIRQFPKTKAMASC